MYNLKREEINNITPISIESSNKRIFLKKINGKDGFTQNITLLQKNENNELINEYVFPLNVEIFQQFQRACVTKNHDLQLRNIFYLTYEISFAYSIVSK